MSNLALANVETRRELTTDEAKLQKALQSKKIKNCTLEETKQTMLFVYSLVGLRPENYPTGLDKDFLHAYMADYYGGHTIEEIRLAFTMAIQQKLEVPINEVRPYENFSALYFSTIMEAYRRWSTETAKALPMLEYKQPQPPRWIIDCEYAYARQKQINKLPVIF